MVFFGPVAVHAAIRNRVDSAFHAERPDVYMGDDNDDHDDGDNDDTDE